MDFELIKKEKIILIGMSIELTTSQIENYRIIRKHWMNFNSILKSAKYNSKSNWTKYGLTFKIDGKYFYKSAIPCNKSYQDFNTIDIPEGLYARFQHNGNMEKIKTTVYDIWWILSGLFGHAQFMQPIFPTQLWDECCSRK